MKKKPTTIIAIVSSIALIAVGGILLFNKYHRGSVGRSNPLQHVAADNQVYNGIDVSNHQGDIDWSLVAVDLDRFHPDFDISKIKLQ